MVDHEGHLSGGDCFGCDDEVAFVFAVGGVQHYDEFVVACLGREKMSVVGRQA